MERMSGAIGVEYSFSVVDGFSDVCTKIYHSTTLPGGKIMESKASLDALMSGHSLFSSLECVSFQKLKFYE